MGFYKALTEARGVEDDSFFTPTNTHAAAQQTPTTRKSTSETNDRTHHHTSKEFPSVFQWSKHSVRINVCRPKMNCTNSGTSEESTKQKATPAMVLPSSREFTRQPMTQAPKTSNTQTAGMATRLAVYKLGHEPRRVTELPSKIVPDSNQPKNKMIMPPIPRIPAIHNLSLLLLEVCISPVFHTVDRSAAISYIKKGIFDNEQTYQTGLGPKGFSPAHANCDLFLARQRSFTAPRRCCKNHKQQTTEFISRQKMI